ncbi:MAG TPA: hypothetical protein VF596_05205 [Pyrinomonadaceae bacterium]|jgi:hypothetical protein
MNNRKGFWLILFWGILFLLTFPAYIILPKLLKDIISPEDADVFKHFIITIAAVIGVHLIDLFFLHRYMKSIYGELTSEISKNLTGHVDTKLELFKIEAEERSRLSKERNKSLTEFHQTSSVVVQEEIKNLTQNFGLLDERVKKLEGLLLHVEYLVVGDKEVTEATIYQRAINEIVKASDSIDIFTSHLLEVENNNVENDENNKKRNEYFETLLKLCANNQVKKYRRIIQIPKDDFLENIFEGKADTYLSHIKQMREMEKNKKNTHPRVMLPRRPTTYVIIDKKVLLWQINQHIKDEQMQMYAMYIVEDSTNILIRHFIAEFNGYYENLAERPKFRSV